MNCPVTRRKCRCCKKFFFPDYRNATRQKYCSLPACRQASKVASQRRWFHQPENRDYFRGPRRVEAVQAWRKAHPGYWRKPKSRSQSTKVTVPEPLKSGQESCNASVSERRALKDICLIQDPAFVGLISMVTGSTLPEDIATTGRHLLLRGRNILGIKDPGNQQHTTAKNL
jgi:hypothetical protein